jgi:glycosyltransferase involved in cell wall biosynthesis
MKSSELKNIVSVIIPAFNAESFIAEAIESVIGQTYKAIEIIVIDDGSKDGTKKVAEKYADKVRIISQSNLGAGAARNNGIKEARGEVIAFLDADDVWFADKVEKQVAILNKHEDVFLVSGSGEYYVNENKTPEKDSPNCGDEIYNKPLNIYKTLLSKGNVVWTSSVIVRRSVFDDIGLFDETKKRSQDYDMWIRIAENNKFYIMSEKVGKYRWVKNSLTHNSISVEYKAQLEIIKTHSFRFAPNEYKKRLAITYADWASSEFCYGTLRGGIEAAFKSIRIRPFNIRIYNLILGSIAKRPIRYFLKRKAELYEN